MTVGDRSGSRGGLQTTAPVTASTNPVGMQAIVASEVAFALHELLPVLLVNRPEVESLRCSMTADLLE